MTVPDSSDICIVGGGPAGLAAAIAITKAGYGVVLFDCAVPPIDKACGEGLLPDGLAALKILGVELPSEAGHPFKGIRFSDGSSVAFATFSGRTGLGLRRTALHSVLVQRAQQVGVQLCWGVKNVQLAAGVLSVNGSAVKSNFVIAADGQNSAMRRQAGLTRIVRESRRYGFRRHYRIQPWSSYMELHWGKRSQLYVTPVASDEVGVALISRDPTLRLDCALNEFPEVRSRLQGAAFSSSERGALSVSRRLHRISTNNLALIGDASGSVDALTGEGIGLAFRQSLVLADALKSGSLENYRVQHRRLSRRPRLMAGLLLLLDKHPGLQRRVLASLASHPAAFEAMLEFHVGEGSLSDLFSWRVLDFCRGFLSY